MKSLAFVEMPMVSVDRRRGAIPPSELSLRLVHAAILPA